MRLQRILGLVRRCVEDYGMIGEDDKIAVGVSGGKDSLLALTALAHMRKFFPVPYTLEAITLDMGFRGMDFTLISDYCAGLEVPFTLVSTKIGEIVFDVRKESHPCSLCANLRRGILHSSALERGCKKIALGHHMDDASETFLMSLLYEGRISCFKPVTWLDRAGITLIRPLLYVSEEETKRMERHFPVLQNPCPANGHTKRQEAKELMWSLSGKNDSLAKLVFQAMRRYPLEGWETKSASLRPTGSVKLR